MMYWIVYAFFTCIETFTDIFLSWFPFYYEVKVILVIWLLSPATKGSSTLYRKFVHPMLTRREHEIDEYLNQAKEKGYTTVLQLGSKGMNYATSVIMQTAIKVGWIIFLNKLFSNVVDWFCSFLTFAFGSICWCFNFLLNLLLLLISFYSNDTCAHSFWGRIEPKRANVWDANEKITFVNQYTAMC